MSGTIAPVARQVFLDNSGNPLSGGLLYSWEAGTSTELPIYADLALATECTNPVILNAAGRPTVNGSTETNLYFSAATYKLELRTSAGVSIWIADNVPAVPSLATALDIEGIAGENLTANDAVYLADGSGGTTQGSWYHTDADNTYSSSTAGTVGMVPTTIASGQTGSIRLQGRLTGLTALAASGRYYASATPGAITATPPTNQRYIGQADSTTSIIVDGNPGAVRLPDSNGTHSLIIKTTSNLTADRILTFVTGDASRTITITGDGSIPVDSPLGVVEGRLTGTSATPVTTANVTGATSIYYTPYIGNRIALYDGSATWNIRTFTEITIALAGLTASRPYDIFAYDNATVVTIETLVWTNATTRATALAYQNGVLVKSGATTRRYLGTIYINSSGGQTDDSLLLRNISNYYNRRRRPMAQTIGAVTWSYSAGYRQANADAANQLEATIGYSEDTVDVSFTTMTTASGAGSLMGTAIGVDSTSVASGQPSVFYSAAATTAVSMTATYRGFPGVGRHVFAALETGTNATITWYGSAQQFSNASGMSGSIWN